MMFLFSDNSDDISILFKKNDKNNENKIYKKYKKCYI